MSKKEKLIIALFNRCRERGKFTFDNDLVKEMSRPIDFKNQFDATKIDHSELLPDEIRDTGYCIAHLGKGRHKFIKELGAWNHQFEPITENEREQCKYKPSLLNHTDESESNIVSVAYNQKIIQHFLYGDIVKTPMIYMSRRTKITASYNVGMEEINVEKLQVELDATFELNGEITVLEAKNELSRKSHVDFAVYQIFHPFLYYHNKNIPNVKKIECCYLLQNKKEKTIRLYLYSFPDINDMKSIQLVKKSIYNLKAQE